MANTRNTACRVYNRVVRAHKRDNNLFFWIPGFIRSFERVLRVQSRINIRFFLFSSFGVRGKCSTKRSLVFHSQKKRTYVSGVSTKYNKRDNRAYKTGKCWRMMLFFLSCCCYPFLLFPARIKPDVIESKVDDLKETYPRFGERI